LPTGRSRMRWRMHSAAPRYRSAMLTWPAWCRLPRPAHTRARPSTGAVSSPRA
jgi:hypothetical protein